MWVIVIAHDLPISPYFLLETVEMTCVLKRHLSGWQAFSLLQSALSLQRLHCGSLLLLANDSEGIIETEKGQMNLRDVDYQLQTVKIDLNYTLLYIDKRIIS